jgi:hypothetical protein
LIGRGNQYREHMGHRVDHDESLAPLGLLPCVVGGFCGEPCRSNSLTVDDGGSGTTPATLLRPGVGSKPIADARLGSIASPGSESMK